MRPKRASPVPLQSANRYLGGLPGIYPQRLQPFSFFEDRFIVKRHEELRSRTLVSDEVIDVRKYLRGAAWCNLVRRFHVRANPERAQKEPEILVQLLILGACEEVRAIPP